MKVSESYVVGGVVMGNKNLDRKPINVMDKLCKIQEQFGDAVIFQIGITKNAKGKVIDIISAKNTFNSQQAEVTNEKVTLTVPEVPDYIG
jgi:hypothetical protein